MQALAFAKPVEWLFLAVSLSLSWRYAWLLDDAFVYFRYVDNWLFLKRGLVFNAGEFVEGYTSPFWVLSLGLARLTRVDYWSLIRMFSVSFAACFWVMCIVLRRRLTRPGATLNLPLALFVVHYGVQSYFSSGLETPLVQLLALVYALLALAPKSRGLAIVAGLAPLVRPDLALPFVVYVVGLTWQTRRPPSWLIGSCLFTTGGWLLFRIVYYADLLPNTYYLKDETNFSQGFLYLANTLRAQGLGLVLLGLAGLATLVVVRSKREQRPLPELHGEARLLMLAAALVSVGYVLRAGGDMLFYRFLAFPLILTLTALHGVGERCLDWLSIPKPKLVYPGLAAAAAALAFLGYPSQLRAHPATVQAVHGETMRKVDGISDASWHRYHPELRMSPLRAEQDRELLERYARYRDRERTSFVAEGFCARAYFAFDKNVVHSWGLTEPILARTNLTAERPGHKYGLLRLARDLKRARQAASGRGEPGMVRRAVERRQAAAWIGENLEPIELLEHKMYNQHRFGENLALAFAGKAPIVVAGSERDRR